MENIKENQSLINEKSKLSSNNNQSPLVDSVDGTKRRSSNRSIKRKKFDDELVEYSLGVPGVSNVKSNRSRTQSHSDFSATSPSIISSSNLIATTTSSSSTTTIITTTNCPTASSTTPTSEIIKRKTTTSKRGNKRGRQPNQFATKDLGRWKPTDDLALIIGVQQTNDLRIVHLGTKFSCKFTVQELQQRWYALLYDKAISRVAVQAIRNLHPDMIANVQDKALWSQNEEQLLSTIKSNTNPTIETFAELLSQHPDIFYSTRSPNVLYRHWQTLKMYHLLPDQILNVLPTPGRPIMSFNDAEDLIQDSELSEPYDEQIDRELKVQQRKNIKQIRQLENEIGRWNVLVDSCTGFSSGELDGQTLAVLRGRMVRYLMRSKEITIGRCSKGYNVDIDLSLEGPAYKVSRRQGTLRLRNTGEFYLSSEGKRPIFVDGRPVTAGNKVRLYDNAIVEISCLRFIFSINHDLIRSIHDSLRYNVPS